MDLIDELAKGLSLVIGAATWVSLGAIWLKRRKARRELNDKLDDHLIHVGRPEDLARAEAEAAAKSSSGLPELEEILRTHVFVERFNTQHGVSETYISDLERELRARGLQPKFVRRDTLPLGSIGALERPGIFELYVPEYELEDAQALLAERASRT